jgi:hypothetical protein
MPKTPKIRPVRITPKVGRALPLSGRAVGGVGVAFKVV